MSLSTPDLVPGTGYEPINYARFLGIPSAFISIIVPAELAQSLRLTFSGSKNSIQPTLIPWKRTPGKMLFFFVCPIDPPSTSILDEASRQIIR